MVSVAVLNVGAPNRCWAKTEFNQNPPPDKAPS